MGSCTILVSCDTEKKVQIKQDELSKVPSNIGHEGPEIITVIYSTFVDNKEWCVETETKQNAWLDELASFDQIKETEVPPAKDGSNDSVERPSFDLNESIKLDESGQHEVVIRTPASSISVMPWTSSYVSLSVSSTGLSTPIVVVYKSIVNFIPLVTTVKNIGELGWKGSAATSSFRLAEPREITEPQCPISKIPTSDAASFNSIRKGNKYSLDIDLNVSYERTFKDRLLTMHLSFQTGETINKFWMQRYEWPRFYIFNI